MSVKSFITELQNSDPQRKMRWLIGLAAISTAIVIGLWVIYLPDRATLSDELVRKEDQPGFFEKVALTAGEVTNTLRIKTANTINFFKNRFGAGNTIEITTNNPETQ